MDDESLKDENDPRNKVREYHHQFICLTIYHLIWYLCLTIYHLLWSHLKICLTIYHVISFFIFSSFLKEYDGATLEDKFDKEAMPEVLQVRKMRWDLNEMKKMVVDWERWIYMFQLFQQNLPSHNQPSHLPCHLIGEGFWV